MPMDIRRIFVPVDGSELTRKAIDGSVGLARPLGAAIVGFVAVPHPPSPTSPRGKGLWDDDTVDDDVRSESQARAVLASFAAAAAAAGVPFDGVSEQVSHIDKAIIAAAESRGCDLIVMVTHGRGAFGEFLFGSQTKAVLAGSKLPLLVLR